MASSCMSMPFLTRKPKHLGKNVPKDTSRYIKIHQQILEYILDSSPEICPSDLGKLYFPLFGPGKPHHLDAGRALLEAALQLAGKAPVKPMMALDFG